MDKQDQQQGGHPREGRSHHQNEALVGCLGQRGGVLNHLGASEGSGVWEII